MREHDFTNSTPLGLLIKQRTSSAITSVYCMPIENASEQQMGYRTVTIAIVAIVTGSYMYTLVLSQQLVYGTTGEPAAGLEAYLVLELGGVSCTDWNTTSIAGHRSGKWM